MSELIDENDLKAMTGGWDRSTLPENISIGENCFLERHGSLRHFRSRREPGLIIGNHVKVFTWTEFNIERGGVVEVGDDSILVGAILMCAESICIGDRVVVSYNVTIADSDFHPRDPELRKQDAVANAPAGDRSKRPAVFAAPVVIEDDVWIGIGAIILKGVRIGCGARIGAGAVITKDVAAGMTVVGNPARPVEKTIS
jgi:acetyltransferase-like isoleucine patch superfamily enzyme